MNKRICAVTYLGITSYQAALKLQQRLVRLRTDEVIPDLLLLLQHPPVFTVGRFNGQDDIIVSRERLSQEGIKVFETSRGGSVTYHGPGQLVGYPILKLKENHLGVRQYIWKLEGTVIRTLADFGIDGQRVLGRRGVWVGEEKVCALGLRINGKVSMHGFALNVNTDLKYFSYIRPCGIPGMPVTSVAKLLGHQVEIDEVREHLLRYFSEVFKVTLEYVEKLDKWLTPSGLSGLEETLLTR